MLHVCLFPCFLNGSRGIEHVSGLSNYGKYVKAHWDSQRLYLEASKSFVISLQRQLKQSRALKVNLRYQTLVVPFMTEPSFYSH